MRKILKLIIHCTATPNGRPHTAADIDRWHKERGWSGIGYHYVIRVDGTIDSGRPVERKGAHAKGHNSDSIGICMIGTYKFTREQWDALSKLLTKLGLQFPDATVHGHREFNSHKTCPGFAVPTWLLDPARVEKNHLLEVPA